jgi:hypothetical protein
LDSIGQGDVSSPQILPCEFKYWHAFNLRLRVEYTIRTSVT